LFVIAFRIVFGALFGAPVPGAVLVRLPEVDLPAWAAGVRVGGEVTLESTVAAGYAGLQLATLLACVGAANALANPKRLLRAVPGALYEVAVAVVVALSFSPQLVEGVRRVRAARRLRGRPDRGLRGLRGVAMPVLEGALERSVDLAAAMDARGFGRVPGFSRVRTHRLGVGFTTAGLLGVCAGSYGLLDPQAPVGLGLPMLAAGAALAAGGLWFGGRGVGRTRYRPDPWTGPEWLVTASGVMAAAGVFTAAATGVDLLVPVTSPLQAPQLPVVPALAVLAALTPAWLSPPPHRSRTAVSRAPAPVLGDVS
jgi:energy-coupling factor transport system permease protein